MAGNENRGKILTAFCLLLIITDSCSLFEATYDPMEIILKGESFSLSWNDESRRIPNNPRQAVSYRVYYRIHGTIYWRLIKEIEANGEPRITVTSEDLDHGVYDLGVSTIDVYGKESVIHSSLDNTADPFCGWYINWIGSE